MLPFKLTAASVAFGALSAVSAQVTETPVTLPAGSTPAGKRCGSSAQTRSTLMSSAQAPTSRLAWLATTQPRTRMQPSTLLRSSSPIIAAPTCCTRTTPSPSQLQAAHSALVSHAAGTVAKADRIRLIEVDLARLQERSMERDDACVYALERDAVLYPATWQFRGNLLLRYLDVDPRKLRSACPNDSLQGRSQRSRG